MPAWTTDHFYSNKVLNSIFNSLSDTHKKTIFKGTIMGMGYEVWPIKRRSGLYLEKVLFFKIKFGSMIIYK